jgi:hypothetical protein
VHPPRFVATAVLALVLVACSGGRGGDGDGPVAAPGEDEVAQAEQAADCEVTTPGVEGPADHIDPEEAPAAEELYPERPTVGGQHFGEWLDAGVYDAPVEERAAVHNLEHGAVALYHDPDLDVEQVQAITEWASSRNEAGLLDERTGAGIVVAPWEAPLDPPIAFRAWGVAADCQAFETAFADGFVRDHFGSAGEAPEGSFGGDPNRVVGDAADV